MNDKSTKIQRYGTAAIIFAVLLYFGAEYVLPILVPFVLAYVVSRMIRPISRFLKKKTHISEKIWSFAVIIILTAALVFSLYLLGRMLYREISGALEYVTSSVGKKDAPINKLLDKITAYTEKSKLGSEISKALSDMLSSALGKISSSVAGEAGNIISKMPGAVFGFFVFLISVFYFTLDDGKIEIFAKRFLPDRIIAKTESWVNILMSALKSFARAYLTIFLITFAELFAGFLLIGVDFAFLIALVTAVVDVLPVLGVGTVLIPWSIWLFLTGAELKAVFLLVLFGIISAVRQFIEPKIVGDTAGIHPLFALVAVYTGYSFFGVVGMVLSPLILYGLSSIFSEKEKVKNVRDKVDNKTK